MTARTTREAEDWFALMRSGRFEDAWKLSDLDLDARRSMDRRAIPRHLQNRWDGSPVADRRVLVRCYHGLGDTVQFARYLPRLRDVAREVIVWTPPELIPLLARSIPGIQFIPLHDGAPDVEFDVDVELMELPHVFRTTVATIPSDVPYLHPAAPHKGAPYEGNAAPRKGAPYERNGAPYGGGRPRVGLVWRGGGWDPDRSIPFELVQPFFSRYSNAAVVPLQASLTPQERGALGRDASIPTIDEFARRIVACDLVITVDTLAAHLAGALGVPVWTVLKSSADWRWMTGRCDSPGYPSMRVFRQPLPGAWAEVIREIDRHLGRFVASLSRDGAEP
jgi:hypothetical protein